MRNRWLIPAAFALIVTTGCDDGTAPRDVTPPVAPRGVYSVTGDQSATLHWLDNTESDLWGYRIYAGDCPGGCDYLRVGTTTTTSFQVGGLTNGVTKYFAVSAVDRSGNESALTPEVLQDTPRPAGAGLALDELFASPATSGYDFSAYLVRPWDDGSTDVYFQDAGGVPQMVCPFTDTDIQDAGYATTLDAVDLAPQAGWSASGTVELIPGHCYVVRIGTTFVNYGKFQVTGVSPTQLVMDWAYQIDPNNRELHARPVTEAPRVRRMNVRAAGMAAVAR